MTVCRYCSGRGVIPVEQPIRPRNVRGAAARMIPFGNDVARELANGRLSHGLLLLVADEPLRDPCSGQIVGKVSRWDSAKRYATSISAVMVLPDGEGVDSFSWPRQHAEWWRWWDASITVWAFGFDDDRCRPIGEGLVLAGFDAVKIQRFDRHDLMFKAG